MSQMTRGQLAAAAGIGAETVRFYEKEGLLLAPMRGSTGYRQYTTKDLSRLRFIKKAKILGIIAATGLSIILGRPTQCRGAEPNCSGKSCLASSVETAPSHKIPVASLQQLKAQFNDASGQLRLVTLVSPTCEYCVDGHDMVAETFRQETTQQLKGLVVWVPMIHSDKYDAIPTLNGPTQDSRISESWDENGLVGEAFKQSLGLTRRAWDVYLLYAPGVKWSGDLPPKPTFWMHQLEPSSGADQKLCLDKSRFRAEVKTILAQVEIQK